MASEKVQKADMTLNLHLGSCQVARRISHSRTVSADQKLNEFYLG